MTETITILKNLKLRRIELREEIINKRNRHYEEMYILLRELYLIEKRLNPKYTLRQLAEDTNSNEGWIYKIMSYDRATLYTKGLVDNNDIGMAKVCRIISKVPQFRQNEIVRYTVENKLTDYEIDNHVRKHKVEKQNLIEERKYKTTWNIVRDINHYTTKIKRSLLSIEHIPKEQVENVTKNLINLKSMINAALKKIRS